MPSASTKIGHGLAKVLGIKLEKPENEEILRGESVFSVQSSDTFVEEEPTTAEWLLELLPSGQELLEYIRSLFPFLNWIGHYNLQWFLGDLVAGVTVGAVVVPQGMAYALLAKLDPQFGLYSSFMGVILYWFFATSKDITIGVCYYHPVAMCFANNPYSLWPSCQLSSAISSPMFRLTFHNTKATRLRRLWPSLLEPSSYSSA